MPNPKESALEQRIREQILNTLLQEQLSKSISAAESLATLLGYDRFILLSLCASNITLSTLVLKQLNFEFRGLFQRHNENMELGTENDNYFVLLSENVPLEIFNQYLKDVQTMLRRIEKIENKIQEQKKLSATEKEKLFSGLKQTLNFQLSQLLKRQN
jgi:hypothetical protein